MWCIFLVFLILRLIASFFAYTYAFLARKDRGSDPYNFPAGDDYIKNRETMVSLIGEMEKLPYERVYTFSKDKLRLTARYYHVKDGAPVQIQCHGYRGNSIRDFCGGNKLSRECGHNALVIEHRAHGESGGNTISFGINERHDVLCSVEYLENRFGKDVKIIPAGVSMGAATVLMASDICPASVRAIVADCPYSSPSRIIKKVACSMGFPSFIAMPLIFTGALLFGRFHLYASSSIKSVKNARVPILLIHGESDSFVPCEMSREIAAACKGSITFITFPDAGHGMSFISDYEKYKNAAVTFFRNVL